MATCTWVSQAYIIIITKYYGHWLLTLLITANINWQIFSLMQFGWEGGSVMMILVSNTGLCSDNNERMLHWRDITIYTETEQSLLMILCSLLCFQSDVTMTVWQSLTGELCVLAILACWLPLLSLLSASAQQIFSHLAGVKRLSNINLLRFAINNTRISQTLSCKPRALLLHLQIGLFTGSKPSLPSLTSIVLYLDRSLWLISVLKPRLFRRICWLAAAQ